MDLKDFLLALPKVEREAFARRCGTTFNRLRQIAYGNEPASPELSVSIDRETAGQISYRAVNAAWEARGGAEDHRRRIPMDWSYIEKKAAAGQGRRKAVVQ